MAMPARISCVLQVGLVFSDEEATAMTTSSRWMSCMFVISVTLVPVPKAWATTIPLGIGAFAGSTLTTFTGLANGTEVNGLIVDGIQFSYSLGNSQVVIDGGPGDTNNITFPNIVSVGNNAGVLTLLLPGFVDTFGYGYAIQSNALVANATTISLFNGVTPLGSLSYDSLPDPNFTGGFAGIHSTDVFDRVEITFNSAAAPAFALDNIRLPNVPEPPTLVLLGTCVLGMTRARSRPQRRSKKGLDLANRVATRS